MNQTIVSMNEALIEKIEQVIIPFLAESNFQLFDLIVHQHHGSMRIEVLVDRPDGGINISECTLLNRRIIQAFEDANLIEQHFTLEVSSPGLDRPLKTPQDFFRIKNQGVRFFLNEPILGKLEHVGFVRQIEKESVTIDAAGQSIKIPFSTINKAKLELNFK